MAQIAVAGAGALGMLLAGRLAAAGADVTVWTRTEAQARIIREAGIAVEEPIAGGAWHIRLARPCAVCLTAAPGGFGGIVLLAVKQTALDAELLSALDRLLAPGAAVVPLLNGYGHVERLEAALPGRALVPAVTTEAALRTGAAAVRHTGAGETWIGGRRGADASEDASRSAREAVRAVERLLNQAGFSVSVSNEIRERMLRKLLVNAVVNPLTALWRVTNGELTATPDRLETMGRLFRETLQVLRAEGLRGESDELWAHVLGVCRATAANRSSMLQDVLAGRRTEIDALNGAVLRIAEASGIPAPWNAAAASLVKAILPPEEREA